MIRGLLFTVGLLGLPAPALAQTSGGQGPLGNIPYEWTREAKNDRVYYTEPDGSAEIVFYRGEFWPAADIVDQFAMGYEMIGCTRQPAQAEATETSVAMHEVSCPDGVGPARIVFFGVSAPGDVELSVTLRPGPGADGAALVADMQAALMAVAENRISLPRKW